MYAWELHVLQGGSEQHEVDACTQTEQECADTVQEQEVALITAGSHVSQGLASVQRGDESDHGKHKTQETVDVHHCCTPSDLPASKAVILLLTTMFSHVFSRRFRRKVADSSSGWLFF